MCVCVGTTLPKGTHLCEGGIIQEPLIQLSDAATSGVEQTGGCLFRAPLPSADMQLALGWNAHPSSAEEHQGLHWL